MFSLFIVMKWLKSGSNLWPMLLIGFLYIIGFGIRAQNKVDLDHINYHINIINFEK